MKAIEGTIRVSQEGGVRLSGALLEAIPRNQECRAIVLVAEREDLEDEQTWKRMAAERFLAGYSQADAIYDTV
ncbi:MAG: hypothetical protein NTW86_02600 [Candidatus Sumerlaeota bacterium]|nr:hypothetical protein [Candidatus Sumerlaeota bacterium]